MKQAGILGIAGFLMASRKSIVLWSPRTFLRLWCGFEIGTFLRDRQSRIQAGLQPQLLLLLVLLPLLVLLRMQNPRVTQVLNLLVIMLVPQQ